MGEVVGMPKRQGGREPDQLTQKANAKTVGTYHQINLSRSGRAAHFTQRTSGWLTQHTGD